MTRSGPLKDGYYDHSQNSVEYMVLRVGPPAPTKKQTAPKDDPDWSAYFVPGPLSWMG